MHTNLMEGYCMKCKKKVAMVAPHEVTGKSGKVYTAGTCATCGGKVSTFTKLTKKK